MTCNSIDDELPSRLFHLISGEQAKRLGEGKFFRTQGFFGFSNFLENWFSKNFFLKFFLACKEIFFEGKKL